MSQENVSVQTGGAQSSSFDDELIIMDFTDSDKEPEQNAKETGTQVTWRDRRATRRRMRRVCGGNDTDDCSPGCSGSDKKMLKKMVKKFMRKMMLRRLAFRMCYGRPQFDYGYGGRVGCRRRRIMAAMMSAFDSSSDTRDESECERPCHRKKYRRRCGKKQVQEGRGIEKSTQKALEQERQTNVQEEAMEPLGAEKETQTQEDNAEQSGTAMIAEANECETEDGRNQRGQKKKCRRVHFSSSETSSSSDSSSD